MTNKGTMSASVNSNGNVTGNVENQNELTGFLYNGGGAKQKAVLYAKQYLTEEQTKQARENIQVPGEIVTGRTFTPYSVDEANNYAYIYDEPVVASACSEIFNDYENNIAAGEYSTAMGCMTQSVGNYSIANGWWTRADGQCAVASGLLSRASGHFTHAEGTRTQATVNNAHSEGDLTIASGRQAHAEGAETVASGYCSHSEGYLSKATNYFAHAEGQGTLAKGRNQAAMGKFNIGDTTNLIIVGNGSSDTKRSNAFTVSSAGNGWFAGPVTSIGADHAEFFEWADGNPNAEDRIGLVVTLVNDKIRLANAGDYVLGIITGTAIVLGDNPEYEWKHKYLTDNYGRRIYEKVEEFIEYMDYETMEMKKVSTGFSKYPLINPEYDPNEEYVSREKRKEWDPVGLIGKLYVNDDGTSVVGGYVTVSNNGFVTASSTETNMRVLKRVTDNVILIMMK